jgi:hypothetical protein
MDYNDIREEVLLNIDADVKSYNISCSVDKRARQICSSKHYWDKIFTQHGLPLSPIIYSTPKGWIKAFEKEQKLKVYMNVLFDTLHMPKPISIYDDDMSAIYVNAQFYAFNQLYDLPNIDAEQLSEYWNKFILHKLSKKDIGAQMIIQYDDGYIISFIFNSDDNMVTYDYETTKPVVIEILHRVLSAGVVPYDVNGETIEFI